MLRVKGFGLGSGEHVTLDEFADGRSDFGPLHGRERELLLLLPHKFLFRNP